MGRSTMSMPGPPHLPGSHHGVIGVILPTSTTPSGSAPRSPKFRTNPAKIAITIVAAVPSNWRVLLSSMSNMLFSLASP